MGLHPAAQAGDGRERGKGLDLAEFGAQRLHHALDERIAKAHAFEALLRVADGIEDGRIGAAEIGVRGAFIQQRRDAGGHVLQQRHLHKNERLARQAGVKKAVAAAVFVQAVFGVGPAGDVVHRLVFDELFHQRRRRLPADALQVQKRHVKPGGKQRLKLGIERQQALVALEGGQQLGAHVHQKTHAVRKSRKALQQPRARRNESAAQTHFGLGLGRRAQRGLIVAPRLFQHAHVGGELLAHQQPAIVALLRRGPRVPLRHASGQARAFHIANQRIAHGLQLGQRAAQHARRQRLALTAQKRTQALAHGAGRGAFGSGRQSRTSRLFHSKPPGFLNTRAPKARSRKTAPGQDISVFFFRHRRSFPRCPFAISCTAGPETRDE